MNAKLEAIADKAAEALRGLIKEGEPKILESWDEVVEEAQAQETEPKLKLGFAITLDLDKSAAVYDLSFSVRYKLTTSGVIPDPNQPELPDLGTVTITGCGTTVTCTSADLKRAGERLARGGK